MGERVQAFPQGLTKLDEWLFFRPRNRQKFPQRFSFKKGGPKPEAFSLRCGKMKVNLTPTPKKTHKNNCLHNTLTFARLNVRSLVDAATRFQSELYIFSFRHTHPSLFQPRPDIKEPSRAFFRMSNMKCSDVQD